MLRLIDLGIYQVVPQLAFLLMDLSTVVSLSLDLFFPFSSFDSVGDVWDESGGVEGQD